MKFYLYFLFIFSRLIVNGQTIVNNYIIKDSFTKIISINEKTFIGDDFAVINVFYGEKDKVEWGTASVNTSFRYLGVDNQNNLRILRKEYDYNFQKEDICELIFKITEGKPNIITLLAMRNQQIPIAINISVEAMPNSIKCTYNGDLPKYKYKL